MRTLALETGRGGEGPLRDDAPGTAAVTLDAIGGLVRVAIGGRLRPAQVDALYNEVAATLAGCRAAGGRGRVLIDASHARQQSTAALTRVRVAARRHLRVGDRVAVVVRSCLDKARLRDLVAADTHQLFVSARAAETWLSAAR